MTWQMQKTKEKIERKLCRFKIIRKKMRKKKMQKKKFASFLKGREKKEGNGFFFHEICPNV